MLRKNPSQAKMIRVMALLAALSTASATFGVMHTVQFGGSVGFAYSPKTFTANVGDTVKWTGDFSMHPLSSTTIPANAVTWHNGSGTAPFEYAIKVAGTYDYKCDVHSGMTGSFTVNPVGILENPSVSTEIKETFEPITGFGPAFLRITNARAGNVSIKLFSALGDELFTLRGISLRAGTNELRLPVLPKGYYFVRMIREGEIITKTFSILR
jgi:plastocyanin